MFYIGKLDYRRNSAAVAGLRLSPQIEATQAKEKNVKNYYGLTGIPGLQPLPTGPRTEASILARPDFGNLALTTGGRLTAAGKAVGLAALFFIIRGL